MGISDKLKKLLKKKTKEELEKEKLEEELEKRYQEKIKALKKKDPYTYD